MELHDNRVLFRIWVDNILYFEFLAKKWGKKLKNVAKYNKNKNLLCKFEVTDIQI